ncbi:MAG: nuclear transport factor 2 family protein [Bacteroidales bacterium]|nr:nuclear transport factor 2 family protein [Bacteroidales bacterium]
MKKILLTVLTILTALSLNAQPGVVFEIKDGLYDMPLKASMEVQVSRLLTAINSAAQQGGDVNFSGINIDDMASFSVASLWSNVHFRTFDEEIVTSALTLKSGENIRGYQVRGIEIEMIPIDDTYKDDLAQEVCIDFDKSGKIVDFNLAIGVNQYIKLFREGVDLDDIDQRMQILHYIEQFKKAYNTKNIKFMEDIFSEDALIITGKVIKRVKSDIPLPPEIQYTKYNKQQYLNNLRKVFARNGYINVNFLDIRVRRHGAKPNYYGVTLKQDWNSSTYSDEGILFLIWDFSDEDAPKIHVRTWQPLEDQKVFSLSDFKLP